MGKYIKKSKIAGDVSVKDLSHSHPTTLGFRTRSAAKNIALHRLRSHSDEADSFNYLQLRNRRLVKLPLLTDSRKHQQKQQLIQSVDESQTRNPRAKSEKLESETTALVVDTKEDYGDKGFDFDSEDRSKSSDLIRDSKTIQSEIEDFFAYAEQQQQRFFIQKYNFDIVSENPLPGRYEWVKVVP